MVSDNNIIEIYTDGACLGNPGKGGWGAYLIYNNHKKEISGSCLNTTNNRMELQAVIEALKILKNNKMPIKIYTDSNYVKNGITIWIHNWKKNGWKNSAKKDIKNSDLWAELDNLAVSHKISWHWVKGHNGNIGNEKADILATEAAKKLTF